MSSSFSEFRAGAAGAIADLHLQAAMETATANCRVGRAAALAEIPDPDDLRDQLKAVRSSTMAQLGEHLEQFELRAVQAGAKVHWAQNGPEANRVVLDIICQHKADAAVKSKSMLSEEIGLNRALSDAGVTPVETDLGEWIVQLAGETPSHIIIPAIHKTRDQVAELLSRETHRPLPADDIPLLVKEARRMLREKFLTAAIGISGANIGVAETGSVVLVTNEGNGRMVTSLPPVHIVVMGIEKIAPTWEDAAVWLSLLARSATGQALSIYTTIITGPARPADPDGPGEVHIILLDNGRSRQVGTPYEEVLQCIRCGACLNVCPVYRESGGHSYGSPYSGPIGAVVSPLLMGLEQYEALPHASSLCGACLEVCPVRIDLPRMLLELRKEEVDRRVLPWYDRWVERIAARVMGNERLFQFSAGVARALLRPLSQSGSLRLPSWVNPAHERRLPALAPRSFRDLWKNGDVS